MQQECCDPGSIYWCARIDWFLFLGCIDGCGRQLVSSVHTYTLTAWTHLAIHRFGFTASTHFPASAVCWWPSCLSIEWKLFCVHCVNKCCKEGGPWGFFRFCLSLLACWVRMFLHVHLLQCCIFTLSSFIHVFYIDIYALFQRQHWGNLWDRVEPMWAFPSAQIPSWTKLNWTDTDLHTQVQNTHTHTHRARTRTHTCTHTCTHTHTHRARTHTHAHTHAHTHMHTHMYIYNHTQVTYLSFVHMHTHTHAHTHVYI